MPFLELRDRVLRLRADARTTEDEAKGALQRVGRQALALLRAHIQAGTVPISADIDGRILEWPCDPNLWSSTERTCDGVWQWLMEMIGREHPDKLPAVFGDYEIKYARVDPPSANVGRVIAQVRSYPATRWRQRAEDYIAALDLLAQVAGETKPTFIQGTAVQPSGRSKELSRRRTNKPQRAHLRAAASYEWVCRERPDLLPKALGPSGRKYSRAQWVHIRDHGCPSYCDEHGNEISVPEFETWKRQVRAGQADPDKPRTSRRAGRETGKSIVSSHQI